MTAMWHITLFGGLSIQRGEQTITRFKYQKVGGLLGYLAYYPRRMHSRELLVEMFWPESAEDTGRNNLSVALSSLRHQLEPPGTPAGSVLRADRYSVGLNPSMVTTDVEAFESALRDAERAGATERVQHLEQAVGLYGGPLLPAYYEEWISPEQERLAGLYFDATTSLLTCLEERGDLSAALQYARLALAADSLREEAHERLIRLLAAAGQSGAALRQYKELERLLEDELGVEPSAPLRQLARQIEKDAGLTAPAVPPVVSAPRRTRGRDTLFASAEQPTTVTFLMTDIEGSTRQWEQAGDAFKTSLDAHHRTLRAVFSQHRGQEIKEAGDSFLVVFPSAKRAVECAVACQKALREAVMEHGSQGAADDPALQSSNTLSLQLKVRMAVHTGDLEHREGDWQGLALHRASRILTAGHGGQILVSEATAGLVRRDVHEEIRLSDLGVYRLRDVPGPERLYEAHYPGIPESGFPALAAESGFAGHLPPQFTRFFGREQEIARLVELLSRSNGVMEYGTESDAQHSNTPLLNHSHTSRLVTLTGPGGTGKSRLALETAERVAPAYQGAVWFVALADIVDSGLIAGTILDALRVPHSPQREPLDQVVEFLSRQPALLVLDNFEQLVEGGAELVQLLLERIPTLTILVTSRQLLGLSAEREFPVPPLPTPGDSPEDVNAQTPEYLTMYDSVRLFVDRAQAVMPHFQVSNHNAPAVAELCDRLEGIPLAIELAAARAQSLTPGQMLAQLSNRFDFLASKKRGIEERHRTLRAAVEWSYRLLAPEVQRFFARLSVFRGGWDLEAAEAVCEEPLALDYLALLRDCSLLLTDDSGPQMRWRMLETLREYAAERLSEAAEATVAQKRHAEYFAALAERAEPELKGAEQAVWLERLETEHDNLRAALEWCAANPGGGETGLRLSGAVSRFWTVHNHLSEGIDRLSTLLAADAGGAVGPIRAKALHGAGTLALFHADYATAQKFEEESLSIWGILGDRRGIALSLNTLGMIARDQGDSASARKHHEQALAILRELGDRFGIAGLLNNLANLALDQGDCTSARSLYEEALLINRELGNRVWQAYNLGNLGRVAQELGDFTTAQSLLEECLALARELGDRAATAKALGALAIGAIQHGRHAAARSLLEECLEIRRQLENPSDIAHSLGAFGSLAAAQGHPKLAVRLWGAAERLREKTGAHEPLTPNETTQRDREVAAAREELGDDAAFDRAWGEGRAMKLEDAIALALEDSQ